MFPNRGYRSKVEDKDFVIAMWDSIKCSKSGYPLQTDGRGLQGQSVLRLTTSSNRILDIHQDTNAVKKLCLFFFFSRYGKIFIFLPPVVKPVNVKAFIFTLSLVHMLSLQRLKYVRTISVTEAAKRKQTVSVQ